MEKMVNLNSKKLVVFSIIFLLSFLNCYSQDPDYIEWKTSFKKGINDTYNIVLKAKIYYGL
jgi:hypothetical protein